MASPKITALAEAHARLNKDLDELKKMSEAGAVEDRGEWLKKLRHLHKDLRQHFHFEEEDGYMADVQRLEPNRERIIHELAAEHQDLDQALLGMIESLEQNRATIAQTHAALHHWFQAMDRHEHKETGLIQEVFQRDYEAED